MKKIIVFLFSLFISINYCYAQQKDLNDPLTNMTNASIKGDSETLIKYTSPRLIKVMGGNSNALKLFKEIYSSMLQTGVSIDSIVNYTKGPIYNIGQLRYLQIPQIIIMNTKEEGKKLIGHGLLLALNETGKGPWTFLDYGNFNQQQVDILLPEFKGVVDLVNRPETKPILVDNTEVDNVVNEVLKVLDKMLNL
jgi:hypothetical protein